MLKIFRNRFEPEKLGRDRQEWQAAADRSNATKHDPEFTRQFFAAHPPSEAQEKRRKMLAIMRAEWERTNPGSRKDWTNMSHTAWMRLQIWAQEQVGIEVTPEQRREVSGEIYKPLAIRGIDANPT
jgi:hypothetical protein